MNRELLLVDAFADRIGVGNRAGVVLDAGGLDAARMQRIASHVDASETAFGLPAGDADDCDLEVRFFSRSREIPVCGHATIAFHYARARAADLPSSRCRMKTAAGTIVVDVLRENDDWRVVMTQRPPTVLRTLTREDAGAVLEALSLSPRDLADGLPIEVICTGHAKVLVPVRRWSALDAMKPDRQRLIALSPRVGATGFFAFTRDIQRPDVLYHGRMFAPASGVDEDPVTGNANGPAGYYLLRHGVLALDAEGVCRFRAVQGERLGRSGIIEVALSRGEAGQIRVQVAGVARVAESRSLDAIDIETTEERANV